MLSLLQPRELMVAYAGAAAPTLGSAAGAGVIDGARVLYLVLGLAVGIVATFAISRLLGASSLSQAKAEAQRIREQAQSEARTEAEKIRLDAERGAMERKEKSEKELEAARSEIRENERRLAKREDLVDRKEETLGVKEQTLSRQAEGFRQREERLSQREAESERILAEQKDRLYKIADLTPTAAREMLLERVESESRQEVAKVVRKITEDAEHDAKAKAREITLMAIQRFAGEHTSESTVRTVEIPSDDMKGRIIGREGRNIRAIEKATGVDIIVDDTPGVIVVSCFDKVRQAVAVESLNRLIADGRMHPTRIEEVVEKVRSEIGEKIGRAHV